MQRKFPKSTGAGAGVTFYGTGARVKKVTPITSAYRQAQVCGYISSHPGFPHQINQTGN